MGVYDLPERAKLGSNEAVSMTFSMPCEAREFLILDIDLTIGDDEEVDSVSDLTRKIQ